MKTPIDTLLIHGHVLTMAGDGVGYLADGALAIQGNGIQDVGPTDRMLSEYEPENTIDASGHAILPGLIDCHVHTTESLLRGVAQDIPDYMEKAMAPYSRALTSEFWLAGTRLNVLESIKAGTTTSMDFTLPYPGWAEFYAQVGVRARLTPRINELAPNAMSEAKGQPYAFDSTKGRAEFEQARTFAKRWHGAENGRITVMAGPQAPDMLSRELLIEIKDWAERDNLMIHMHVAQGDREIHQMQLRLGMRSVAFLDELGYLNDQLFAVHLTEALDDEVELLVQRGVSMGVCSGCIGLLDGIVPPAALFHSKGGHVGLGTDSASSNNCINLFNEMKLTALFNKIKARRPDVIPAWVALRMATIEGARAIGLGDSIGSLECGKQADIILVDLGALNLSPVVQAPIRNIVPNLVYAASGHEVDSVMVAGQWIMRHREILTLDESDVRRTAQEAAVGISLRVLADPQHTQLGLLDAMQKGRL